MNGAISDALIAAYTRTRYRVDLDGMPVDIYIGRHSTDLAALMRSSGVTSASMITAFNPFSRIVDDNDNRRAHAELIAAAEALNLKWRASAAIDSDGNWPVEHGLLLLGIPRHKAIALAQRFGQNAIVCVDADGVPALVLCR